VSHPYQKILRPHVGAVVSGLVLQVMHLYISVAGVEQSRNVTKLQENPTLYAFLARGVSGMGSL
jgi:hypothetical protein